MISVISDFNMADIDAYIAEEERAWYDAVIQGMSKVGRKLVDKARAKTREDGGFGNITWNLRGSIGMCIVNDEGKIVETYFPPINKGAHGRQVGVEMAESLALYAREITEITMVFVAAENYARLVQAKGKDVIDNVIGDNIAVQMVRELGI